MILLFLQNTIDVNNLSDRKKRQDTMSAENRNDILGKLIQLSHKTHDMNLLLGQGLDILLSVQWLSLENRGVIMLLNADGTMSPSVYRNMPKEIEIECGNVAPGECLCAKAAQENRKVFRNLMVDPYPLRLSSYKPVGEYCIPLSVGEDVYGTVNLFAIEDSEIDRDEMEFIDLFVTLMASAIKSRKREEYILHQQQDIELSNLKYRMMFDASFDGIFLETPHGDILDCNGAGAAMYGYIPDELKGMNVRSLIPEEFHNTLDGLIEKEIESHGYTGIAKGLRKDGSTFPLEVSTRFERMRGEDVVVAFVRDISASLESEKELMRREEMYRKVVETTPDGIILTGHDGTIVQMNRQAFRIFGIDPSEDLDGFPVGNLFSEMDRETLQRRMDGLLTENRLYTMEHTMLRHTGESFLGEVTISLLDDTMEENRGYVLAVKDITARKKIEETLIEKASFPERNPGPIIEINLQGKITYINPSAQRFFPRMDRSHPIPQAMIGLIPSLVVDNTLSRTEIEIENRIYELHTHYIDETRRVRAYVYDITERKQSESIQKEMINVRDALLSSSLLLSRKLEIDMILQQTLESGRRITGATYAIIVTFNVSDGSIKTMKQLGFDERVLAKQMRWPAMKGVLGRIHNGTDSIMINDVFSQKDFEGFPEGHPVMGSLLAVPILENEVKTGVLILAKGETENPFTESDREMIESLVLHAGIAMMNADLYERMKQFNTELEKGISERTEALEAAMILAQKADRAKSEFLAGMSHELRTPLNAIIGFSQILDEQFFGELNATQHEYVKDILASSGHLLDLINSILNITRIDTESYDENAHPVLVKDLLYDAHDSVKKKAAARSITIEMVMPDEGCILYGNRQLLHQMMNNLLKNAVYFSYPEGTVTVHVSKNNDTVTIEIIDRGIGIDKEDQNKIFDEFVQIESGTKGKNPGAGLGLTLARKIARLHKGTLEVESDGPDKGSTFRVMLPLNETGKKDER